MGEGLLQEIIDIERLELDDKDFHIRKLNPSMLLRSQLDNSNYPAEDMRFVQFSEVEIENIESDEKYLRQIFQAGPTSGDVQ